MALELDISFSQGFDWQYSARFPAESPNKFLGINFSTSQLNNFGDINMSEFKIPCCKFDDGSGTQYGIGVAGEYWVNGGEAITAVIKYNYCSDKFTTSAEPSYYRNDTMFTNFELDTKRDYLTIALKYKYRIVDSHFYIAGGVNTDILINSRFEIRERVISDDDRFNDGTNSREVKNGMISEISTFNISPEIAMGYDFTFGKGMFASPYFSLSIPLNSYTNDGSWRHISFQIGINLFMGF